MQLCNIFNFIQTIRNLCKICHDPGSYYVTSTHMAYSQVIAPYSYSGMIRMIYTPNLFHITLLTLKKSMNGIEFFLCHL